MYSRKNNYQITHKEQVKQRKPNASHKKHHFHMFFAASNIKKKNSPKLQNASERKKANYFLAGNVEELAKTRKHLKQKRK